MSIIPLPRQYNFQENLIFLGRNMEECLHGISDHKITKLLLIDGQPLLFQLEYQKELSLTVLNSKSKIKEEKAIAFAKEWLGLDFPMFAFYKMAKKDSLLAPIAQKYKGLSLIGIPDLFEALSWAIIGQQINLNFAYKIKKKLVEHYGHRFNFKGVDHFHFPNPEDIAGLQKEDLLALQFSRQKADYLLRVANLMANGDLSKEGLGQLGYETAKKELIKIKGIGQWSADYALMKCLRFPEAFPIHDVGLHNAIKTAMALDRKPTIPEIEKMAVGWQGHEAMVTFYLWRSLLEK